MTDQNQAGSTPDAEMPSDDTPFTDEEIRELTTVIPTDPKDVIAAGLTGTMPHLPDGLTWGWKEKRNARSD